MIEKGASVQIESVSHQFKTSGLVLDKLKLSVSSGEFVALLGPSGCGKSTLLRLIANLEKPIVGTIHRDNEAKSFVFQEATLLPWRTAVKNVELPLEIVGVEEKKRNEQSVASLSSMGLEESLHKFPQELSGGMKMRVSVARALVTSPSLLLLDEPFAALDEGTRFSLQNDLRKRWLSQQMTVFFVTHSISEAVYLSDRIVVLTGKPGRIAADYKVRLPAERSEELRLSVEFLNEVREVTKLFRLGLNA